MLGRGRRTLLLGKEDIGYVPIVPIEVDAVLCPTLSLMGIDRSGGPTVEQALRDAGVAAGDRIGVVGWKTLSPEESSGTFAPIFAPAFVVDTLREIAGGAELVVDVTAALTSPRSGLRSFCSADQIAVFEWGASRCSAYVMEVLRAARPGVSERDAFRGVPWGGEPLSYHPVLSSGADVAVGLRSPSTRRLELGDAAIVGIGLWGGNCARGGVVAASEADLGSQSDGYLEELAVPYWRAIATWYESLALGVAGGDIFERITDLLAGEAFASSLNPGHLIHYEEWLDSPIRAGSSDPIASGMVIQSDIIPTGIRPGWTANCEDTVAIGDAKLRAEIESRHPELWSRINPGVHSCVTGSASTCATRSCRSHRRLGTSRRSGSTSNARSLTREHARRASRSSSRAPRAASARPIAEAVVDEGGAVALLDIDSAGADTAARPLRSRCRALLSVRRPVARGGRARRRRGAELRSAALDGLVNNAGVNAYFDAVAMTEDDWDSVFAVDLKAAWMLAKAALPATDRAPRCDRQHQLDPGSTDASRLLPLRGREGRPRRAHPLACARVRAGGRARQRGRSRLHRDPPRARVARPPGRSGGDARERAREHPARADGRPARDRQCRRVPAQRPGLGDHRRDARGRLRDGARLRRRATRET